MPAFRRLSLSDIHLRLGAAAFLAVALQFLAIFAPLGSDDLRRVLFVLSYLSLLAFVALNLRRPGLVVLGAGVILNFLPVITNGGLMPITPQTLEKTGDVPEGVEIGEWVPHSKDVLKNREDIHFYALSDRLTIDGQSVVRAFSIGDVVIAAGVVITLGDVLFPRYKPDGRSEGATGPKHSPDTHV